MTYDGSEETYWCREEVPESWMSQSEVLSSFYLDSGVLLVGGRIVLILGLVVGVRVIHAYAITQKIYLRQVVIFIG